MSGVRIVDDNPVPVTLRDPFSPGDNAHVIPRPAVATGTTSILHQRFTCSPRHTAGSRPILCEGSGNHDITVISQDITDHLIDQ